MVRTWRNQPHQATENYALPACVCPLQVRNMQQALADTKATNSSQSAELKELRATNNNDKQQLRQLLGQVCVWMWMFQW